MDDSDWLAVMSDVLAATVTEVVADVAAVVLDTDPRARHIAEVQKEIRALALVAHEYLAGGGRVVEQRGWFRAREVVVIDTVDGEWVLGRRSSRNPRGL